MALICDDLIIVSAVVSDFFQDGVSPGQNLEKPRTLLSVANQTHDLASLSFKFCSLEVKRK